MVKERLENVRESLTYVAEKGEKRSEMQEMMERYVVHCEKAMVTGNGEDLPKMLELKLEDQKRDRQEQVLANGNSPPKSVEIVSTPAIAEYA